MNASDKRRARRFPMTLPVAVKTDEIPGHDKTVHTHNVSSSGVYFEFGSPVHIGTPLEFIMTLPEQITKGTAVRIKCVGKVVRVDRPEGDGESLRVAATIERYEFLRES